MQRLLEVVCFAAQTDTNGRRSTHPNQTKPCPKQRRPHHAPPHGHRRHLPGKDWEVNRKGTMEESCCQSFRPPSHRRLAPSQLIHRTLHGLPRCLLKPTFNTTIPSPQPPHTGRPLPAPEQGDGTGSPESQAAAAEGGGGRGGASDTSAGAGGQCVGQSDTVSEETGGGSGWPPF
jgi:hypothetical protein